LIIYTTADMCVGSGSPRITGDRLEKYLWKIKDWGSWSTWGNSTTTMEAWHLYKGKERRKRGRWSKKTLSAEQHHCLWPFVKDQLTIFLCLFPFVGVCFNRLNHNIFTYLHIYIYMYIYNIHYYIYIIYIIYITLYIYYISIIYI
jgi:hypothetical protein